MKRYIYISKQKCIIIFYIHIVEEFDVMSMLHLVALMFVSAVVVVAGSGGWICDGVLFAVVSPVISMCLYVYVSFARKNVAINGEQTNKQNN